MEDTPESDRLLETFNEEGLLIPSTTPLLTYGSCWLSPGRQFISPAGGDGTSPARVDTLPQPEPRVPRLHIPDPLSRHLWVMVNNVDRVQLVEETQVPLHARAMTGLMTDDMARLQILDDMEAGSLLSEDLPSDGTLSDAGTDPVYLADRRMRLHARDNLPARAFGEPRAACHSRGTRWLDSAVAFSIEFLCVIIGLIILAYAFLFVTVMWQSTGRDGGGQRHSR